MSCSRSGVGAGSISRFSSARSTSSCIRLFEASPCLSNLGECCEDDLDCDMAIAVTVLRSDQIMTIPRGSGPSVLLFPSSSRAPPHVNKMSSRLLMESSIEGSREVRRYRGQDGYGREMSIKRVSGRLAFSNVAFDQGNVTLVLDSMIRCNHWVLLDPGGCLAGFQETQSVLESKQRQMESRDHGHLMASFSSIETQATSRQSSKSSTGPDFQRLLRIKARNQMPQITSDSRIVPFRERSRHAIAEAEMQSNKP
jgi:hypothetical protein